MKNIKSFLDYFSPVNEAVIMPTNSVELIKELTNECCSNKNERILTLDSANKIGSKYGVIFKSYNDFYESLPEHLKHTAPPSNTPIFGLLDENNKINVVLGMPKITLYDINFISHIIQHESVHKGQEERRNKSVKYTLPDPKDSKSYFSTKDEIMAFSQSIIDMMLSREGFRDISQLRSLLKRNPLYNDIKKAVDEDVLKRYNKYIYQYAEQYLNKE